MKKSVPLLTSIVVVALGAVGAAAAGKPKVGPPPPKLFAVVGPAKQLSLKDAHGKLVASLKPGWYTLEIKDSTDTRTFRLRGPGINKGTGVEFEGAAIWGVNLRQGKYSYLSGGKGSPSKTFSVR